MTLGPDQIALRVGLAMISGALVGLNREAHGRAAGLRTMMLVCTAGALSMLISINWPGPDKFDASRVAQGLLTGVGFLGAGCIIKEGAVVRGITTAATLWVMTVLGIAYGAGELILGGLGSGAVLLTLTLLAVLEHRMLRDWDSQMTVISELRGPSDHDLLQYLQGFNTKIEIAKRGFDLEHNQRETQFKVRAHKDEEPQLSERIIEHLSKMPGVLQVSWSS